MIIELRNKEISKTSQSVYYTIFVNDKSFSMLRVSDHIKKNWKGYDIQLIKPRDISEEDLIEMIRPSITKRYYLDKISNLKY